MRAIKNTLGGAIVASLLSTTAMAHTNSIGYVGDGSGGLNFWYGSWHDGTTFNEAEIKIIHPDGTTSIDAFDLLEQDSPAGLISGVNFFTSDGTQLVPYDPSGATNGGTTQESYTWQGINYQNLATGQYTFVYIPLGDTESQWPNSSPTADWDPMDQVIRSLTINLTNGDLTGDANNNGILDINEVASGSASGGPTVVSQGSSSVVGYIAVTGGVIQVVQRTQTDTTWDNMSDGTTANTQTTTTELSDRTGRVDQVDQMLNLNLHRSTPIADGIESGRISHEMGDGYDADTRTYSLGHTVFTEEGMSIQGGITKGSTTFTGSDSTGSMESMMLQGRVGKALDDRDITIGVGAHVHNSDIEYSRTIGDFSAAGSTSASDIGANITFEKSTGNVRPFVGYTVGKQSTDAYDETGDAQVALSHDAAEETYRFATVGINIDAGMFTANFARDFDDVGTTRIGLGIDKHINDRISIGASANRSMSGDNTSTYLSAGFKINF
jgi:hypothetical protein